MATSITPGQQYGMNPAGTSKAMPLSGQAYVFNTPLAANGIASTGWIPVGDYMSLLYIVQADQSGMISAVEYSTDGTNVSASGTGRPYTTPNRLVQVALTLKDNYFRLSFTNGNTAQTTFYFELKLSTSTFQNTMSSIHLATTLTNLASLTKSILELDVDGSGNFAQLYRTGNSLNVHVDNPADNSILAKETGGNLAAILAKLISNPATEATLAAILAKLIANPATETTLNSILTKLNASINIGNFPATQPVSLATNTPDVTDRAGRLLGNVSVSNFPATQNVSISNMEARDFIYQQTIIGNCFVLSTGLLQVTAVLGNLRAYINNPAGSGKTLYIYSIVVDNGSTANAFGNIFVNPTVVPSTQKTIANMNIGSTNTASTIATYADVSATALSGGTQFPASLFAPANMRTEFLSDDQVVILPPGNKIGVNVPITLTIAANCQVILYGIAY